jgi:hypothetical protein
VPLLSNGVSDLLVGAVLTAGAYWWLRGRKRNRAVERFTEKAREEPHRLLNVGGDRHGDVVGRSELIKLIASELDASSDAEPEPMLISGEVGSGRTALLLRLVSELAQRYWVPVPVAVTGDGPIDLAEEARKCFSQEVTSVLASEDEADVVWRALVRSGVLVILADGIDEVALRSMGTLRQEEAILTTLQSASRRGLRVIATLHPASVKASLAASTFELPPVDGDDALAHVASKSGDLEASKRLLAALDLELTRFPIYLNVVRDLVGLVDPATAPERDTGAVRTWLLDHYVECLFNDRIAGRVAELRETPDRTVRALAALATVHTLRGVQVLDVEESVAAVEQVDPHLAQSLPAAIDAGERLRLLDRPDVDSVRFRYRSTQAYFTARAMRLSDSICSDVLRGPASDEMVESLLFACTPSDLESPGVTEERARTVTAVLLDRTSNEVDDTALALATAGIDVAGACGLSNELDQLVQVAIEKRAGSGQGCKLSAIGVAAQRRTAGGMRLLWRYAVEDDDFNVRWPAAERFAEAGALGFALLYDEIKSEIRIAKSARGRGEPCPNIRPLGIVAWVLPTMAVEAPELRHTIMECVDDLFAIAFSRTNPLRLEIALARGIKLAAEKGAAKSVGGMARRVLGASDRDRPGALFWYSRICAVHALAIGAAKGVLDPEATAEELSDFSTPAEHPLVAAAATSCAAGLRAGRDWRHFVWHLEGDAVASTQSELGGDVLPLLGDAVLLLNLFYSPAHEDLKDERNAETAIRLAGLRQLPACLSTSRDREELFKGCSAGCALTEVGLCPHPGVREASPGSPQSLFSEAFCRRLASASSVPSWTLVRGRKYRAFWRRMEREVARRRGGGH